MASNRKLDDLFDNAELPFGHSGRNYDDTPVDFDEFKDSYEPPAVDPHEDGIVLYGPGYRPLCGEESELAVHTDDPGQVAGCEDCLEMVSADLQDNNDYADRCLHCRQEISAQGGVAWRRAVRRPCPHCGRSAGLSHLKALSLATTTAGRHSREAHFRLTSN